ncbi:hypothetical protein SALBM311S_07519 [Streptomyces alboniger]
MLGGRGCFRGKVRAVMVPGVRGGFRPLLSSLNSLLSR